MALVGRLEFARVIAQENYEGDVRQLALLGFDAVKLDGKLAVRALIWKLDGW